jgi:hypothetical protein
MQLIRVDHVILSFSKEKEMNNVVNSIDWFGLAEASIQHAFKNKKDIPPSCVKSLVAQGHLTQQQCIKFGLAFQRFCEHLVNESPNFELVYESAPNRDRRTSKYDIVGRGRKAKNLFHRESKTNLQLDTEKAPAVEERLDSSRSFLQTKYPNHTVDVGILVPYYDADHAEDLLGKPMNKHSTVKNFPIQYMKDFIEMLGIDGFDRQKWIEILKFMGEEIVNLEN